ncbi:DUF3182 family protein [Stutzerimonas zhaodongensis]|uniref:DUF3182 family protein n=1 Tax=Stutzerimonas zhaodongensis TaxID=1176257 RepID=A0A3M2I0H2_9GAMM|nr:DUF3182 family protein [Stutzerimonas zhaodongensis]MCQ4316952.1 DUF3182 family protein [Stutzerimonas zhaodongensis]RMH92682.1 DUF3182 family protein [Stutzerimonas zhaodongensis]
MINADQPHKPRGAVVTLANRPSEPLHERAVHEQLARRLAVLQGMTFLGAYDRSVEYPQHLYFVPSGTIVGTSTARELGLDGEEDLFGGVVPQPFIETKAISHPLVRPDADAPIGWSRDFVSRVIGSVLPGYSMFSLNDAREAGRRLLHEGAVRLKPVRATGGRGQERITTVQALDQALAHIDEKELAQYGLVLEANLEQVTTFSVGQIRVAGNTLSYYGTQRLTSDNSGETVYGGSDLVVSNGDFDALLALDLPEKVRLAVSQAQIYDDAASACFRGFFASRRNYDIAQGIDGRGRACSGVLEQSWRIGGASGAEIAALDAFRQGARGAVRASTVEVYGEAQTIPHGATVLFRGEDAEVGFITKYVTVEAYGDAK